MVRVLFLLLLLISVSLKSQDLTFLDERYSWSDNNKIFDAIPDSFKNDGAVILSDDINLDFSQNVIKRRQAIKILNEEGLNYFKSISLPQNFDIAKQNNPSIKQGRFSKRLIPFIYNYKINYFAARIIRNNIITEIPVKVVTNKVYWLKNDGERIYDYEYIMGFEDLQINDIIEYVYKAEIKGDYDSYQFYAHNYFAKLKTNLSVKLKVLAKASSTDFIFNNNIDTSIYTIKKTPENTSTIINYNYEFKSLNAIKYPENYLVANTLPHITVKDVNSTLAYKFNESRNDYNYVYISKYQWFALDDSVGDVRKKIYDKNGASLRKFISNFPENNSDTTKTLFVSQLTDTLNNFKYLRSEQLHYSENAEYTMSGQERLFKRQIIENYTQQVYSDILFEKNIFYYDANVLDRRIGVHSNTYRTHEKYELKFIALPIKGFYKFYIPRKNGIKYLPDELPFYYEGTNCVLFPRNTKSMPNKKDLQKIKFVKTPISNYNENIRTENAVFKINIDSNIIHASIKENLNGQFSTILRHYYNKDFIDSTIKVHYFKKCVEKPNSSNQFIKLSSQSKIYPFKTSYICSENISISKDKIDLSNWFSFLLSEEYFKNKITQDYYLDFTYTDNYNFLLEFNKPVVISNLNELNLSLTNEYFEISSIISKQSENKYLLAVTTKAKQYVLPQQKSNLLIEYVKLLDKLNTLNIKLSY